MMWRKEGVGLQRKATGLKPGWNGSSLFSLQEDVVWTDPSSLSHSSYPLHVTLVRMEILLLKESSSEEARTTAGAERRDTPISGARRRELKNRIRFYAEYKTTLS